MTPGPADEARRALRAARERLETAPGRNPAAGAEPPRPPAAERTRAAAGTARPEDSSDADAPDAPDATDTGAAEDAGAAEGAVPPAGPVAPAAEAPEHPGPRPADAARAALRQAASLRRAVPRGTDDSPAAAAAAGDAVPPGAPAPTREAAPDAAPPRDPRPSGAVPHPARPERRSRGDRPGDAAREALRAALDARQARAADAAEETGSASRPPRARAATPGEAAVRARAVRELVAGAFRLPVDSDPTGETPAPAAEPPTRLPEPPGPRALPDSSPALRDGASRQPEPSRRPPADTPSAPPATLHHADPDPASADRPAPPAAPRAPRSMAAPGRDGEHRRTFPAFPARTTPDGAFAETWWGNAWVTALEEGALDAARLARGRGYAERGHVDAITVTPGLVLAYVRGSRPRPYRVQVRLRTLDDDAWERFLETAAERPGHIAALLDKELPHSLADCGIPLLPGPGDLAPQCSCPDSGHPCKHAAALCYQTARLLDADPFVLLLLRGRGERELIDALSRLSAARAARAARSGQPAPLPGVRASEALAPRRLPPLPAPPPAPPHPEQPPAYPAAPGGPDPFALDQLATDAAARAHTLLTTGRDPVGELTLWQDAVRLAAARPGSGLTAATRALYASLAAATGRTTADLARAVAAWRQGGLEGLTVLEEPWDPPAGRFDRARPLLLAADLPAFRPWRNRLTHPQGHIQLRLGRDGLWYAYESEPGRDDWWPRGTPDLDPVGALTGLGVPGGS
ncbi:SWIM zinc finger family protein [Streptomyces leeuwenhoekii]|uniref:SWIM zinc finger family protein n=1 Tax=Streptomyces leeuwenhoekii TaxID=1437453 RepID=UPI0036815112